MKKDKILQMINRRIGELSYTLQDIQNKADWMKLNMSKCDRIAAEINGLIWTCNLIKNN